MSDFPVQVLMFPLLALAAGFGSLKTDLPLDKLPTLLALMHGREITGLAAFRDARPS